MRTCLLSDCVEEERERERASVTLLPIALQKEKENRGILALAVSGSSPEPQRENRGATRPSQSESCRSRNPSPTTTVLLYASSPSPLLRATSVRALLHSNRCPQLERDSDNCYPTAFGEPTGPLPQRGSAEGTTPIPTLSECLSTTFSPTSVVLSAEAMTMLGDSSPAGTQEEPPFGAMPVDHEGASPQKLPAAPNPMPQQGFPQAITDMLRGELQAGFATQQSRLSEEIGEAMAKMNKRVEAVEKGVTKQLQQTLASIQELAVKQEKQAVTLVQRWAETKQLVDRVLALEEQLGRSTTPGFHCRRLGRESIGKGHLGESEEGASGAAS